MYRDPYAPRPTDRKPNTSRFKSPRSIEEIPEHELTPEILEDARRHGVVIVPKTQK
jgi:hypothetical protein